MADDAPGAGPVWALRAQLAGFIKKTTIHCYTQNMKALGLVASEKKIFFYVFSHDAPGAGPVWTPGARLAGFINRTTIHCYTQNVKALCLVVSRRFFCFVFVFPIVSLWELMTPGAGPFLTPGARLAGFIKRTTIHCYTQNRKALCLVVAEKIFFNVFPIVSLWDLMTPLPPTGRGHF